MIKLLNLTNIKLNDQFVFSLYIAILTRSSAIDIETHVL